MLSVEKSNINCEVKNVEVQNCHSLSKLSDLTKSTHEKCPLIIKKLTEHIQLKGSHCWRRHDTVQRTACQHGAMVRRLRLKGVGDPLAGGPLPLLQEAEGLPGEAEGLPGHAEGLPGEAEGLPGEAEGLPGHAEGLPGEAEGEGGARLTALPLAADVDRGAGTQGVGGQHA
jgi:hypothetical protein